MVKLLEIELRSDERTKKSSSATTRVTTSAGFDGGRERMRRWFRIWPRRGRRWPEERDQRGDGAILPAMAMVAESSPFMSLFPKSNSNSSRKTSRNRKILASLRLQAEIGPERGG
jgi:hypothetical protein